MRPEFNPKTAGQPVSTYELEIFSAQIAFADNGIIAIVDNGGTIHLFDKQYNPLHTFTCRDDEVEEENFEEESMPTQMVFDAHGNILMAIMLYKDEHQGLLRFNTNGKRLPDMSVPEVVQGMLVEYDSYYDVTGVTRDPHGNIFFRLKYICSDLEPTTRVYLCKQANGSEVSTVINDDAFGQYDDVRDVGHYINQLAYGPNGHLYVVSPDGIQEFDSTSGNKLQTISLEDLPIEDNGVNRPEVCFSLTVSGDGYIFVVPLGRPDVYVFSQDGSYLNKLSAPNSRAVGGTAIDQDGFLHVVDQVDGLVYVF